MSDAGPDESGAGTATDTVAPDAAPPTRSQAALAAYERRMRPLRIGYAIGIAAAVVVALVIVKIAYSRGEISHVTLHTVASAPPSLEAGATSTTLTAAWTSTDTTALGDPLSGGTVVTHDAHTVRGRSSIDGKQTWSYTRTDRSVCAAIQTQSVTIAVYKLHGNCDELTGLDTDTGQRKWARTLDKDGAEFNGPASYSVVDGNVMFVTSTSIYAIAPGGSSDTGNGGLDYWTFHHVGCTINGAVLGSAGALISQTCKGQQCSGHKFCGDGPQLLLRDATAKYDDNTTTNKNNPDAIIWNDFGTDLVPTSAGQTITARSSDGTRLRVFDAAKGRATATLPLTPSSSTAPSVATSTLDADLLWIGGRTYALAHDAGRFMWQAPTSGPVTIGDDVVAGLAASTLLAATTSGVAALDPATGTARTTYRAASPAGSLAYPLGNGLLVAGTSTAVYA